MTKKELLNAMNRTAKRAGLYHWITLDNTLLASVQLPNLVAVLWYKQLPEDEDTKVLREQLKYLWEEGGLTFDQD